MPQSGLQHIVETGTFSWPWRTSRGLAILTGGSGGGGGGGGAFCMEGLNLYGAGGGGGGGGGQATTLTVGSRVFRASGGDGGSGGNGGGMVNGKPLKGAYSDPPDLEVVLLERGGPIGHGLGLQEIESNRAGLAPPGLAPPGNAPPGNAPPGNAPPGNAASVSAGTA